MVKEKVVIVTGKRKESIARGKISSGKGIIKINSVPLENWGNEFLRMRIMEPLILAGDAAKSVDFEIKVRGGGIAGQSDAIRMVIAKGLVEFSKSKELKEKFLQYDRNLLVFDYRRNEPHHASGRGASKRGSRRHKQR
ncbi:MAG: 30S ribosomal protein S9, partial [Candidatus Aenigmatarchaeota archaeon]